MKYSREMAESDVHEHFMRRALNEAKKGAGLTSPNPAVGALLVADGKIVSRGHHRGPGLPHAEIECLRNVRGPKSKNAVLYVTLEPCSTTGRTPPCTDAIIAAGIQELIVGAIDPNPRHAGRGLEQLRAAGIRVHYGVLASECALLNEAFNKWIQTRRPFVIAKCGMSLDGRLTRLPGEPRRLTSAAARRHAHETRAQVDAILIGAETLRQDNPRLTVRDIKGARQPWRVVISRAGNLPRRAHLFTDRFADRTLLYRNKSLEAVLRDLGTKEITSVLIEGGGEVLGHAFDARLIDQIRFYIAPLMTGGPVAAIGGKGADASERGAHLTDIHYERVGPDLCVRAYPIFDWRNVSE